jgi:hypothetical protein
MKEFVWINIFFLLNLAFGQVGETNEGKDWSLAKTIDVGWFNMRQVLENVTRPRKFTGVRVTA